MRTRIPNWCLVGLQLLAFGSLVVSAQRSPYSLQAAVDELHHREASKYPLNAPPAQQYFGSTLGAGEDYWDKDLNGGASLYKNRNRQGVNKALTNYLQHENYLADNGDLSLGPFFGNEFDEDNNKFFLNALSANRNEDKKKRSSHLRERDNKYESKAPASFFRERETPQTVSQSPSEHAELTEQFLREIEETQENDREDRYKDALRNLWEKYQQQENEIEGDLFEEKHKRMRVPPYYMLMQKKRAFPVLPWLPYKADKRFPVAKRSTKSSSSEPSILRKTDEKVAKELSELFGSGSDDVKEKRSIDEDKSHTTVTPESSSKGMEYLMMHKNSSIDGSSGKRESTPENGAKEQKISHKHRKRSEHHHEHYLQERNSREREHEHGSREGYEEPEGHEEEESDERDHEEGEEEEEDESEEHEEEEEGDWRKKKRAVGSFKSFQISSDNLSNMRRKKSIQWNKYFGLDRKKKSLNNDSSKKSLDMRKRSANEDDGEVEEEVKSKKKLELDPVKLNNMDKKLQSIEDFIIEETVKYTGAHEGIANPEEIRRLKDHVLSRLATAYSLEKMRRALEKLRQSLENDNHLVLNAIDPEAIGVKENELLESKKRVTMKKESLVAPNEKLTNLHSNAMMSATTDRNGAVDVDNDNDNVEEEKRRKKKKRGYLRYPELSNDFSDFEEGLGAGHYEALNDAYLGNKNYIVGSNQCPLIESMAERCRAVDLLSGDINQELLPICGVHQICYLCGTSQGACDYQYLAEADSICGNNNDCGAAARSVLMLLHGNPGPQIGPRECLKNSCLYRAMREIGL